jgi:mono/diheme cytochrome c family protein
MKTWKKFVLVVIGLVLAVGFFAWRTIRRGFSARDTPSKMEILVATKARTLAVPASYRGLSNPVANSRENIRAGMEHFADHCFVCHANNGSGDTSFGKNMYPKPPDMRASETQTKSDGELFYTIYNGIRLSGMPAFGEKDQSDAESTWQLVRFIRHLPTLTEEEQKQMEKLNPKSPMEEGEEHQEEQFLKGGKPPTSMQMKHH